MGAFHPRQQPPRTRYPAGRIHHRRGLLGRMVFRCRLSTGQAQLTRKMEKNARALPSRKNTSFRKTNSTAGYFEHSRPQGARCNSQYSQRQSRPRNCRTNCKRCAQKPAITLPNREVFLHKSAQGNLLHIFVTLPLAARFPRGGSCRNVNPLPNDLAGLTTGKK